MARRVILSDDFTGNESDDVQTHQYMLDQVFFEIDLSADSFASFEKAMAPFKKVSRETRRITSSAKPEASQAERIRQWAVANGMDVSERGRLSADIIAAYEKAQENVKESDSESNSEDSQTDANQGETDSAEKAPDSVQDAPEKTPTKPRGAAK